MAESRKGKIDMTTGHIMKNIILFAIPIIIGNVLQQLYTTVDALVISCFNMWNFNNFYIYYRNSDWNSWMVCSTVYS